MASRKRGSATLDDAAPATSTAHETDPLAELAAAEAAAADARERAKAARARAEELRRRADAAETIALSKAAAEADEIAAAEEPAEAEETADEPADATPARRRLRGLYGWKGLVIAATLLVAAGFVALSAVMLTAHREEVRNEALASEYSDAAREAAATLMGIDYTRAEANLQRILDTTTGAVHEQYADQSENIISSMAESQVVTKVSVTDVAVESMDANTAVILMAVRTERTGVDEPTDPDKQLPTLWRVALTLVREGDQIKVSNLEYL